MPKPDVLLMYSMRPKAMAQLEETYTLHRYDEAADPDAFIAEVGARCVAVATNGHAHLTRAHLAQLPNLRIVACSSAGFENIDLDALTERGIPFTNSSDALYDDVADCALMLTLATRRHLIAAHEHVRSGDWGNKGVYPLTSALKGKRAGIAGLGTIGLAIARRFEPLGLQIGYTTRTRRADSPYEFHDTVLALAEWSDILVVAVPGGAETKNLIDSKVIKALGPFGTLINIARGSVIDEPALITALQSGALGSAGLDVFLDEPDPDPELTALPKVTLYPHHASGTVETRDAMAQLVVDNLAAYFKGAPLLTQVNKLSDPATGTGTTG